MFSKKKDDAFGVIETIIGTGSTFKGSLGTRNAVRIDGILEGSVTEANGVVIGEKGHVHGDVCARSVIVGGRVDGNIFATRTLEILPGARVHGDIKSSVLSVGEGASFEGSCIMEREKDLPAPAPGPRPEESRKK